MADVAVVNQQELEDLPVLSKEEADKQGIADYKNKETGLLNISITPKRKDEEKITKEVKSAEDAITTTSGTLPVKKKVETTTEVSPEKKVAFKADEETVSKKIIRAKVKGEFDNSAELEPGKDYVGGAYVPEMVRGITIDPKKAEEKGLKAGLDYIGDEKFRAAAKKDVEVQKKDITVDEVINNINAGNTYAELTETESNNLKGAVTALTVPGLEPNEIKRAKNTIALSTAIINSSKDPDQVKFAFGRAGKFQPTEKAVELAEKGEDWLIDKEKAYFDSRNELFKIVKGVSPNLPRKQKNLVHQILIDNITTGEFWDSLTEGFNEDQRGLGIVLPNFVWDMTRYGTVALWEGRFGIFDSDKTVSEAWAESAEDRTKAAQEWKDWVGDNLNLKLLSDTINETIHQTLKIKLDKNEIDLDTYKALTESDIIGKDGKPLKKQLVSEEQAQSFLMESIDQLNTGQRFLKLFMGNFTGIGGLTAKGSMKATSELADLRKKVNTSSGSAQISRIAKGKGKFEFKSVVEKANEIRREGEEIYLNHKLIGQALRKEQIKEVFSKMKARRDRLFKELKVLERQGKKGTLEWKKKNNEYQSIKGKVFRNVWSGRTKPVFREAVLLTTPATVVQWAFTETLSGGDNPIMDFYGAQGVGAAFHLITSLRFGGKKATAESPGMQGTSLQDVVYNIAAWPIRQLKDGTSSWMDVVALGRIPGVNILRSRDLADYNKMVEQARGYRLTIKERRAAQYVMELRAILPEKRVKQLLKNIKDQTELEEEIIKQFPRDDQNEIREIITAPFAQASGLIWLKSAYAMAGSSGITAKDLKNFKKYEDMQVIADFKKEQIKFTERAIENLKTLRNKNLEDPELLETLIKKYESLVTKETNTLIDNNQELLNDFIELNKSVYLDPDIQITPDTADMLLNAGVKARRQVDENLSEGEALQQQVTENYELLKSRAKEMKSNLRSSKTPRRSAHLIESVLDTHIQDMIANGKIFYKDLDNLALKENKTIDVSSLLRQFKDIADPLKDTDFRAFFSKDAKFFNSPLNQKLRASLQGMAERYLKQLDKGTIKKLMEMATTPGSKHQIAESMDDIDLFDIALYWQEKSKGGKFKAFNALPSEVTEIYQAFRDFSFRVADPNMADRFENQAVNVANLIKNQDVKYYTAWKKANTHYKKQWFDRIDGDGIVSSFIKSKSKRVTELSKTDKEIQQKFKSIYKKGGEPDKLLEEYVKYAAKFLGSGEDSDLGTVQNWTNNFIAQVADIVDDDYVFDLTTEKGLNKWNVFKDAIDGGVYAKWAKPILEKYEKLDPRIAAQLKKENGGYDFTVLNQDRLDEIREASMVKLKRIGKDGEVETVEVPLLDLKKIIVDEKDIVKVMKKDKKLQESYKNWVKTSRDKIKAVQKAELERKNIVDETVAKLQTLTGQSNDGFYEKYILNGTVGSLTMLRNKAKDKGISEQDFNDGVLYMLTKGWINRGDKRVIPNLFVDMPDGTQIPARGFNTPEVMLADLKTQKSKQIFEEFLGVDHTKYLTNVSDLLARQKASMLNLDSVTGVIRQISDNELISRAFNLARGMVSPTYVGAEFALRIAQGAGIDMVKLAAGNKDAARLMAKMLEFPEKLSKVEVSRMSTLIQDFVYTELVQLGLGIPEFYDKIYQEDEGEN